MDLQNPDVMIAPTGGAPVPQPYVRHECLSMVRRQAVRLAADTSAFKNDRGALSERKGHL